MNTRKLIFRLVAYPFVLPIMFAGFLYEYIVVSFQIGRDFGPKFAHWVRNEGEKRKS